MATIEELLVRIFAQINDNDKVYSVLDNVSKDGTRQLIEQFALHEPRLQLIWAPENRCVVDAYFRGYRAALSDNCQWILEMDGGLSHLPEEIPLFIRAMEDGYEYAVGSRYIRNGSMSGSFNRKIISRGGSLLASVVLGTKMSDMTSGFECFSFDALSSVVQQGVYSKAHFFQTEIKYQLRDTRWKEIPITYRNASPGMGSGPIIDALKNLWRLRTQS